MALFNDLRSKRKGYLPVALLPSASDDSDEDDVFLPPVAVNGKLQLPNEPHIQDDQPTIQNPLETVTNAHFSLTVRTPHTKQKQPNCRSFCLTLICLVIMGILFGFLLQIEIKDLESSNSTNFNFSSEVVWENISRLYSSESVVRLEHINDDGVLDFVYTLLRSTIQRAHFCKSINMSAPCLGAIQGVDGKSGDLLWQTNVDNDVFAMNCGKLDVDRDGFKDCIVAGRGAQLMALNIRTGNVIWSANDSYSNSLWNFYQPQIVPDLNGDGVEEIVVNHGGNYKYKPEELDREAGRILLLSGKTGLSLGRYLNMSDEHETYSAITLYTHQNGAIYILFGSGGETVQGSLFGISLRDLYCYVMETTPEMLDLQILKSDVYNLKWGESSSLDDTNRIEIMRSEGTSGVMVPTILADINNDGVNDLIVSLFNGMYTVLNGNDLSVIWTTGQMFEGYQSYSIPAPGYFNDDVYLDIMVCLSLGTWPVYHQNTVAILDGRDGSTLWSTTALSQRRMMNSPLSVSQGSHKSAFIFWLIGRRFTLQQSCFLDDSHAKCPMHHHGDHKKRHTDSGSENCNNETLLLDEAELLMVDRDSMRAPSILTRVQADTYRYELTNNENEPNQNISTTTSDKLLREENTKQNTHHRKREVEKEDGSECTVLAATIIATGAVSDIDFDGNLDMINLYSRDAVVLDDVYYVRSSLTIQRLKLHTQNLFRVPLNKNTTFIKSESCHNCNGNSEIKLFNSGWFGYMGLDGDGIYNDGQNKSIKDVLSP